MAGFLRHFTHPSKTRETFSLKFLMYIVWPQYCFTEAAFAVCDQLLGQIETTGAFFNTSIGQL